MKTQLAQELAEFGEKLFQKEQEHRICWKCGSAKYEFHEDGSCRCFENNGVLINRMITGASDGSVSEIVVRGKDSRRILPVTGPRAKYCLSRSGNGLRYQAEEKGISAEVQFLPSEIGWLYLVDVTANETIDVLYMQDIGLMDIAAQRTNELYSAQYIAHHIVKGENGYLIASRQNMPQHWGKPCLWLGSLKGKIVRYSTDGTQYFGKKYRQEGIPAAYEYDLPGEVLQGESSCIALQTEEVNPSGKVRFAFFGFYRQDHKECVFNHKKLDLRSFQDLLNRADDSWESCGQFRTKHFRMLCSRPFSEEEIQKYYPERELEEEDGVILSFFRGDHSHVVLQEKEFRQERPTGIILTSLFSTEKLKEDTFSTTAYMYGNFGCQTVIGNTSFHKMTSVNRDLFDLLPFGGTRFFVKLGNNLFRLGCPAAFEMSFNEAVWVYPLEDDILKLKLYVHADKPGMTFEAESKLDRKYSFVISTRLVMGEQEFNQPYLIETDRADVCLRMQPGGFCRYDNLAYRIHLDTPFHLAGDEIFFSDAQRRDASLLCFTMEASRHIRFTVTADLYGNGDHSVPDADCCKAHYIKKYQDFLGPFESKIALPDTERRRVAHTVYWYLHNAMIHYASPHGLEQTGGAAWGTRDVCQGPFELFLATEHYALIKDMLLRVYAHQLPNGEWPQWFMFDRYQDVYADSCHGDIIFWPLKALGDYIIASGDKEILFESVPWMDLQKKASSLLEHVKAAVEMLNHRMIEDSCLLSYGNGDWDDTLQPANAMLKKHMASSWTQALAYQTVDVLMEALKSEDSNTNENLKILKDKLYRGFQSMTIDEIPAGFCLLSKNGDCTLMLHPSDKVTGIQYRLIPMTRAILSRIVTPKEAEKYIQVIQKKLDAPDGVHLISWPTHYTGGNSVTFLRAEMAANVGREIGLQYVHAHIRWVQALAKLGKTSEAWKELLKVTPPLLNETVPNAKLRQSNMYFSSSDADVPDRYSFEKSYQEILKGEIPVKGGWRLYSSGPGIYIYSVFELMKDSNFSHHKIR